MIKQIPNILTFGRAALTFIFLGMVLYSPSVAPESHALFLDIGFVVFVVAGLTDMVDGHIARKLGVASKFGRMLDPFVDKMLVCGGFICFAVIDEPQLFDFSPWAMDVIQWSVAGIITAREVFVTVLRHIAEARGVNFAATAAGKIKMFVQSFAIGTLTIRAANVQGETWGYWFTSITLIITVIVTVVSAYSAISRSQKIDSDVTGG
jgi:CDP-diacylglycerol--glycerol-3-phosphate 3-phosphatidyltransferase